MQVVKHFILPEFFMLINNMSSEISSFTISSENNHKLKISYRNNHDVSPCCRCTVANMMIAWNYWAENSYCKQTKQSEVNQPRTCQTLMLCYVLMYNHSFGESPEINLLPAFRVKLLWWWGTLPFLNWRGGSTATSFLQPFGLSTLGETSPSILDPLILCAWSG